MPATTQRVATGPELVVRGHFWKKAWARALNNCPERFGSGAAPEERRIIRGVLASVARVDLHRAMGWTPEGLGNAAASADAPVAVAISLTIAD